jgi:DNA-binding transcriptional ArsR family regulator
MNDTDAFSSALGDAWMRWREDILGAGGRTAIRHRALGHPTRAAIVDLLRQNGPMRCMTIRGRFPQFAQATISQHLRVLVDAGVIARDRLTMRGGHYAVVESRRNFLQDENHIL